MKKYTMEEFSKERKAQGVDHYFDHAYICPACGTPQSINNFLKLSPKPTIVKALEMIGQECVGRLTGAPAPREKPDGNPCNWSLHGFMQIHTVEVELPGSGKTIPFFQLATPEQAQLLKTRNKGETT